MKYYAVGVPVGRLNEGTERYFFRDGQLLNVNPAVFRVWIHFLHGATQESLAQSKQLSALPQNQRDRLFDQLCQIRMLVGEDQLMRCIPQRQGYGGGFSAEKRDCRLLLGAETGVSYPSYLIWAYSDGKATLSEIAAKLPRELAQALTPDHIRRAVEELLRAGALLLID